jgi:hypothetical protein
MVVYAQALESLNKRLSDVHPGTVRGFKATLLKV